MASQVGHDNNYGFLSLRHIVEKFIGSLMQQGAYKEQLFQSVEAIKACAQAVNDEASQCQARMVLKVYEKTEQTHIVFHRLMDFLLTNPRFQAAYSGTSTY